MNEGAARRPRDTIKSLAKEIRERWPYLIVKVSRGYANTDRIWKNSRLRGPGKGRWASEIKVYRPWTKASWKAWAGARGIRTDIPPYHPGEPIFHHNNAETYRCTADVRRWMEQYADAQKRGEKKRKRKARNPMNCSAAAAWEE